MTILIGNKDNMSAQGHHVSISIQEYILESIQHAMDKGFTTVYVHNVSPEMFNAIKFEFERNMVSFIVKE